MDVNTLKTKLGRWLTIDEIRDLLTNLPDNTVNGIPVNRKLLEAASEFVEQKSGWWEHDDWNGWLAALGEQGFNTPEEFHPIIGSVLEIFKSCYHRGEFDAVVEKRRKPAPPRAPRAPKKTRAACAVKNRA